ncbi:hypothetical protein [Streptomyces sp. WM6378]|uniref:hypothetical protein n=1 Tax=Streptomyces sp. WM6378 TaxID=1415557 RepID=UPI00131B83B7|nr:hypothetical protein [Streptomyces sp. WM6378]
MAYSLGVAPITYENYERRRREPSVPLLLTFGKLCNVRDMLVLDDLWREVKGRRYPRTSDLVGLNVPSELRDLIIDDACEADAEVEAGLISALRAAALRAIHHRLDSDAAVDPNPETARVPVVSLAAAFDQEAPSGGEFLTRVLEAVDVEMQSAVRAWVAWELRRLGHPEAARDLPGADRTARRP